MVDMMPGENVTNLRLINPGGHLYFDHLNLFRISCFTISCFEFIPILVVFAYSRIRAG
jgi:hypothetical protein